MCGVLGIYDNEEVIGKIYDAMLTIQHRGQDSAGILTYDGKYHIKKGNGLVQDIFDQQNIYRLRGNVGIGHTRYPTVGEGSVEDAQPFWVNYPFGIAAAHNGNVTNFLELKKDLFEKSHKITNSNCDVEVILNIFAEFLERFTNKELTPKIIFNAVNYVYERVRGSYSVVIHIANKGMLGFRDPHGIRPLLFGVKEDQLVNSFAFASESAALDTMGFKNYEDVEPGAAIFIDKNRKVHRARISKKEFHPCIFEYIYFARPDSFLNRINVDKARVELGKSLARKIKSLNLDIDVVVPIPDSSRTAAIQIARDLKLKYREGLVKNRYIGRTFIMPGDVKRQKSIRHKLNPIRYVLAGQKVLLVDDSIVRGNTSRSIIQMVRDAGAEKIYFASYSAPLVNPCVYGIDMQTCNEFIARESTTEQIAAKIGADLVIYQDKDEMEKSVRKQNKNIKSFCRACFTGIYPTGDVSPETLITIEKERDNYKNKRNEQTL
ncbi:MAG: amidophosphoribosyltransferase [Acidobacteria bacterium]|jgi:amidophosphoribosyltransferase|nr:amidophosphoribosyltransferase [Acidobacteriota bacterium]